ENLGAARSGSALYRVQARVAGIPSSRSLDHVLSRDGTACAGNSHNLLQNGDGTPAAGLQILRVRTGMDGKMLQSLHGGLANRTALLRRSRNNPLLQAARKLAF